MRIDKFFSLFSFVVFSFFLRPRNKTNDSINQNRKVCIVFVLCIEMQICIAFSCRARTLPSPHPLLSSDRLACAFGIVCACERVSVSVRTPLTLALSLIVISLAKQMRNIVVAQCVYIIYHLPSDFKASSCYHSLFLSLSHCSCNMSSNSWSANVWTFVIAWLFCHVPSIYIIFELGDTWHDSKHTHTHTHFNIQTYYVNRHKYRHKPSFAFALWNCTDGIVNYIRLSHLFKCNYVDNKTTKCR